MTSGLYDEKAMPVSYDIDPSQPPAKGNSIVYFDITYNGST